MKMRIKAAAVKANKAKTEDRDDTFVYAEFDATTKRQIRFKIEENKYGFSGVVYFPKENLRGNPPPERLKMRIVFDRD